MTTEEWQALFMEAFHAMVHDELMEGPFDEETRELRRTTMLDAFRHGLTEDPRG